MTDRISRRALDFVRPNRWPQGFGRRGIAMIAALALLAAGCGSGSDGAAASSDAETAESGETTITTSTEPSQESSTTDAEPILVPDMIGMTDTEARAALSSLGLDDPTITKKESLADPGTVLDQVPLPGKTAGGSIDLVVAERIAPMPDFVGEPIAVPRSWASDRGIEMRTETRLTQEAAEGTVLEQVPAAGAEVGKEILVVTAETPITLDLVSLGSTDYESASPGDLEMNGTLYLNAYKFEISSYRDYTSTGYLDFNLSRDWQTLELTLGIDDNDGASSSALVEFSIDGQVALSTTVAFGSTIPVSLDVTNVLRLRVSVKALSSTDYFNLGLGNAQLVGGG